MRALMDFKSLKCVARATIDTAGNLAYHVQEPDL